MKIDYTISLGSIIATAFSLIGSAVTIIVWFWKYSKRDDSLHDTVELNTRDIAALQKICKGLLKLLQQQMIMQMSGPDGSGVDEQKLREILAMDI